MKKHIQHILILCSLIPSTGLAQNFAIDWHKVAGGGGASSGGSFAVVGTIGQHDAGVMAGGSFSIEGGFLAGISVVQTLGAPLLTVQLVGANAVISWPLAGSEGFVLQETPGFNPVDWKNSTAVITTNGGFKSVTVPANLAIKVSRLSKP